MPIDKFRSFEDAREALEERADDPGFLHQVRWLWALSERLWRAPIPPGIRRYRTLDEAQRDREDWEKRGGTPGPSET